MRSRPAESPSPWLMGFVFLVLAVAYLAGTPDPTFDLRADRLTALAALDEADPYVPLSELTDRYDSDLGWAHVHPRTPGALVLQAPLALVPESGLRLVSVAMTAGAVVGTAVIGMRLRPSRPAVVAAVAMLFGVTSVAVESVSVGAQSSLVALLLAFAWWRIRAGEDAAGGVAVGAAITLKVFPWLILVLLLGKRRRTAAWAVGSVTALNGLGLLFPGVGLGGALEAVSSANLSESAELNGSLIRLLGEWIPAGALTVGLAVVGMVVVTAIVRAPWEMDRQWFAVLAVSLAVSPLIWRHYALVLIPAAVWMVLRGGVAGRAVAAGSAVLLFLPYPLVTVWLVVPTCVAVVIGTMLAGSQGRRFPPVQQPSNR